MAFVVGLPVLLVLAVLQSSVLSQLQLLDGAPDLPLLAVISWALTGRMHESLGLALFAGLFVDLLSGLPFGMSAIILIFVTFLVSLFEGRFWEANLLMPLGVTLIASLAYHLLGIMAVLVIGRSTDLGFALTRIVMPSTFLNLVLILPFSQAAAGLRRSLYPPEVRI